MTGKFSPREKAVRLAHARAYRQRETLGRHVEKRETLILRELFAALDAARLLPGRSL